MVQTLRARLLNRPSEGPSLLRNLPRWTSQRSFASSPLEDAPVRRHDSVQLVEELERQLDGIKDSLASSPTSHPQVSLPANPQAHAGKPLAFIASTGSAIQQGASEEASSICRRAAEPVRKVPNPSGNVVGTRPLRQAVRLAPQEPPPSR